ncbi:MAG: dihydrofolate reductase [Myxococcota bacterium]
MRGIIAAMNRERVIGVNGHIPWRHPGEQKRFKAVTWDSTLVMGRRTFESIGRPLPGRNNFVVSRSLPPTEGVVRFDDMMSALEAAENDVWFIGGRRIYEEAMRYADIIDITWVPDVIDHPNPVRFPEIDESVFEPGEVVPFPGIEALQLQQWTRRLYAGA